MKLKEITQETSRYMKNNFWKLFGIVLLEYLITGVLSSISEYIETSILKLLYLILVYAVTIPLSYGVIVSFIKCSRNDSVSLFDFISDGMKSFKSVWKVVGMTILKLLLPAILVSLGFVASATLFAVSVINLAKTNLLLFILAIIASLILIILPTIYYVVKSLSYSLGLFILYDDPELSSKEIVEESKTMMKGNKLTLLIVSLLIYFLLLGSLAILSIISRVAGNFIVSIICILVLFAVVFALLPYSYALQVSFYNLLKQKDETSK